MILNLPADIYPTRSVASVSGMGGTAAGGGTIAATYLTGVVADRYSFAPILMGASLVPLIAMVAVLVLVRNNAATRAGVGSEIGDRMDGERWMADYGGTRSGDGVP